MTARGRWISLEGGEGAGKSTQARRLAEALTAAGLPVVLTREPGGAPAAEAIRRLLLDPTVPIAAPLSEALLHYAARREHLEAVIWPALANGQWVVCDRYADSTYAYQGHGAGVPLAVLDRLHRLAADDAWPDLTLILDLPVDRAEGRLAARLEGEATPAVRPARDRDRYEAADPAFHRRIREGFLAIAARDADRCVVLDATRDIRAIDRAIRREVARRLGVPALAE